MAIVGFPLAPETNTNELEHRRTIAKVANLAMKGKINALTQVTLAAGVATTTLTDERISSQSFIGLSPLTANAAAALATTYFPQATQFNGQTVINHANNAQTDRTFNVIIIG